MNAEKWWWEMLTYDGKVYWRRSNWGAPERITGAAT